MKPVFIYCLILMCLFACGTQPEKESAKEYPSDYMFAQRSFPSGEIDHKAYRSSVAQLESFRRADKKFDEPWKFEGPTNTCGRIVDLEMPVNDVQTIYAGTASGGIYKSGNQGASWTQIFDEVPTQSIGDMAIDKRNTDLIYVGTGESNAGGGSLAYDGLGVYKSSDAGQSWNYAGLEEVGSIGRVVLDPNDQNTVFVAAMGSLFKNNPDRGVYRTKDGGDSWEQVLFRSDSTGAIDLAIHPQDGNIVYAAMWERIRRPHDRSYGGHTSGIFRSTDGGDTWVELTSGLPVDPEEKGRIGITIAESSPNILYAYYAMTDGPIRGIFRSDDGGDTWAPKSIDNISNVPYIWWFGRIFANPTDPDDVFVTSLTAYRSKDGGDSWLEVFENAHVDHHSFYIHPLDGDLILNGNDGGVYLSNNGNPIEGTYLNGLSNFQFYTCEINPHDPNILLGGAQDNGTNINNGGLDVWSRIFGGDGFRVIVDPNDEDIIYAEYQRGNIVVSRNGGNSFITATSGLTGEGNWNTPIAMDPVNSNVLYTGRQQLFRTDDQAGSWTAISPSLVNEDNPQGVNTFGSLTTIDVSTYLNDIIYMGTDDGHVWGTQDGGVTYDDLSEGLPERWITAVAHDPLVPAGLYVTVSGFRFGESSAQVFYSDDYGQSWRSIGEGLPDIPVNDIVADEILDGKVYVATDLGVFMGENRGEWWTLLGKDLPVVPVIDLDYDAGSRKLAAATYGRGMYTYELPLESSSVSDDMESLKLYPNPASDFIDLSELMKKNKWVEIYDMNGGLLVKSSEPRVEVSSLQPGTYLIRSEKGRAVKFVKE